MNRKVFKTVVNISIISVVSKITGLFRDILIASKLGATEATDIFFISLSLILFLGIVTSALQTAILPVFNKYQDDESAQFSILKTLGSMFIVLMSIVALLVFLFSDFILIVFAPTLGLDSLNIAKVVLQVLCIILPLNVAMVLQNILLQAKGKHLVYSSSTIPLNLTLVLFLLFFKNVNVALLSIAYLVGVIMQLCFQSKLGGVSILGVFRVGKIKLNEVNNILIKMMPLIVGTGVYQINTLIDKLLAARLEQGAVTVLNYSVQITLILLGIVSASIVNFLFQQLSSLFAKEKLYEFKETVHKTISILQFLLFPATVGMIVLSNEIVDIAYGYGSITDSVLNTIAYVFVFYTIAVYWHSIKDVLNRAFFSAGDTSVALTNGILMTMLNLAFSLVLIRIIGIYALPIGTSLGALFSSMYLYYRYTTKFHIKFAIKDIFDFKLLFSSVVMGLVVFFIKIWLSRLQVSIIFICAICSLTGIILYTLLTLFLSKEKLQMTIGDFKLVKKLFEK